MVIFCCEKSDDGGMSKQKSGCNEREACATTRRLRIKAVLVPGHNQPEEQSDSEGNEKQTLTWPP